MGCLEGRVALVTGAARGQGRAEAVVLAREGADVIAVDICGPVRPLTYPPATVGDLEETTRQVEAEDRRILARRADVRDLTALEGVVAEAVEMFGGIDVVVANAGISDWGRVWELTQDQWRDMIDVNLSGVWHTLKATIPGMIERGKGGSIVITSSVAGLKSLPAQAHYSAAKHGLVGLAKSAAIELGEYGIRVNTVHPWGVATPMAEEDHTIEKLLADHPAYAGSFGSILTNVGLARPEDIAGAVLYLASDAARCVTGAQLPVDMGATKV
jgi:SDR family mycofactocin-dependent oxidoreductase